MDQTQRKERIDALLKMIGGLEESIRMSLDSGDPDFAKSLRLKKADYYERLRRVMYGLPEQREMGAEASD